MATSSKSFRFNFSRPRPKGQKYKEMYNLELSDFLSLDERRM